MCKIGEILPFFPECPFSAVARAATSSIAHQVEAGSHLFTISPLTSRSEKWSILGPLGLCNSSESFVAVSSATRAVYYLITWQRWWKEGWAWGRDCRFRLRPRSARVDWWKQSSTGSLQQAQHSGGHRQHAVFMLCLSSETFVFGCDSIINYLIIFRLVVNSCLLRF